MDCHLILVAAGKVDYQVYPFLSVDMKENIQYLVADYANYCFHLISIKFSTKQQKQWLLNWDYMPLEIPEAPIYKDIQPVEFQEEKETPITGIEKYLS